MHNRLRDEEEFKKIEEDIRKRDLDIQFQLVNFCQYLQENDLKQKKLGEKLGLEKNLYEQRKVELEKLEQQCKELTENQKKFEIKVNSLRKYEDYLEKVRSTYSDQYPEMSEILNRYNVLKSNNNDVMKELDAVQVSHEALKIEASNY